MMYVSAEVELRGGGVVCPIYQRRLTVSANVDDEADEGDIRTILERRAVREFARESCGLPGIKVTSYTRTN